MLVSIHKHKIISLLFVVVFAVSAAHAQQTWTLQQCLDTAQINNKNLQINRNNILIGEEKNAEAKSNLIPKIYGNADYRYYFDLPYQYMPLSAFGGPEGQFQSIQFGVPNNINANVQFAMPLYNPQVYGAIQTSKIAGELTELQYQKSEEQIYFEISVLYYNAQILYHQLEFVDSNLVNTKRLFNNTTLLRDQLLATGTDVNKVQLQLEQLTTQKEFINSNYEQVINALKFAMGIEMDTPIEIDPSIIYQNSVEYAVASPIDVRVANTQFRILASELKTLKNSRLPSLALYGTYGTNGYGYTEKPNQFLDFHPIGFAGLQLSIPLFNGTTTQKKIKQKKIEIQNSELQVSLLSEQNDMQVLNASQKRIVAQSSVKTISQQIELAKSVYNQTVLQQKQGIANLTDVLLADNTLREAQQNYLTAVIDYLRADLELKKLTGNIGLSKN
ncbi:MAG TPA: TolC family protein [Bacteroidales bacterium]